MVVNLRGNPHPPCYRAATILSFRSRSSNGWISCGKSPILSYYVLSDVAVTVCIIFLEYAIITLAAILMHNLIILSLISPNKNVKKFSICMFNTRAKLCVAFFSEMIIERNSILARVLQKLGNFFGTESWLLRR